MLPNLGMQDNVVVRKNVNINVVIDQIIITTFEKIILVADPTFKPTQ